MPIEIIVPRLGWSMEEGAFGEWLKKNGEYVKTGEMIFVLEGEKASQEIESFDRGILYIPPNAPMPGETVAVGQVLAYLLAEGELAPQQKDSSVVDKPARSVEIRAAVKRVAGPAARRLARELGIDLNAVQTTDPTRRVRTEDVHIANTPGAAEASNARGGARFTISPRARRRARELGIEKIESSGINGSGRNGRVRERDVLALAKQSRHAPPQMSPPPVAPGTQRPASRLRRAIAKQMLAGVQQTAPVTLTTKVDARRLTALREQLKSEPSKQSDGTAPTYNDILLKLVAAVLPECPELNACWHNDGVYLYDQNNIAIAVEVEGGLVAPVIHNAGALSLAEIASQTRSLVEQARRGALSQRQLQGGTFTLTNLGAFGIEFFTPIINLPQTAALGVGRIAEEPVIEDGRVALGKTLSLSLTFDHRVIDGAPAARWLQRLGAAIENVEFQTASANSANPNTT